MSNQYPFEVSKIAISADGKKPDAIKFRNELIKHLKEAHISCTNFSRSSKVNYDMIIALGGDGYMLNLIKELNFPSIPILGINYGTVGALMNPRVNAVDLVRLLQEKAFKILPCKGLVCEYLDYRDKYRKVAALNEFVLERADTTTIRLDIILDGHHISRYSGDGLIASTSIGSTAYSLAAGGPVLHSSLEAFALTPISPHKPVHFRSLPFPIVMPLGSTVEVKVIDSSTRPVRLVSDGKAVKKIKKVTIKAHNKSVNIIRFLDYSFTGELVRNIIGDIDI